MVNDIVRCWLTMKRTFTGLILFSIYIVFKLSFAQISANFQIKFLPLWALKAVYREGYFGNCWYFQGYQKNRGCIFGDAKFTPSSTTARILNFSNYKVLSEENV